MGMSRLLHAQSLVYDQLDFYLGTQRVPVGVTEIEMKLFVNNQLLPWDLVDGSSVVDGAISASRVYYNGISSAPGYSSIRFFPDRVGFWRLIFSRLGVEIIKEYDITSAKNSSGGLIASFSP